MELICQCCGHHRIFENSDAAFQAGWDAPPHFSGLTTCERCPSAYLLFGEIPEDHLKAHLLWAQEGRS